METRYWLIEGYDGLKKIFEMRVKAGCFSDRRIESLLRTLTAKAGLSYDEIIGAYARKGTRAANDLLEVRRERARPIYSCGDSPFFTARIVVGDNGRRP